MSLRDLTYEIGTDVFAGWAAYINAYDSPEQEAKRAALAEAARKAAEHDDLMNQAAKAIR